jgi:DNA primase
LSAREEWSRDREWQPRGGGRGGGQRGGGRYRGGGRDNRDRYRRNEPPPEPVDPRFAINRGQRQEHTFLAFCIALPEHGEQRLGALDVDDYFSAPATRQAAAYLRGRLRSPTAHLPAGDEALARLVAKLVVDSDLLEATPAKFELEGLQLELHRLERRISSARVSGATGVHELALERQRILDEIRHKLS